MLTASCAWGSLAPRFSGKAESLDYYRVARCENLALAERGATAEADSNYYKGHRVPGMAIDGDLTTTWLPAEGSIGGWLTIVLPEAQMINGVQWFRRAEGKDDGRAPYDYDILVSPDGEKWQKVVERRNNLSIRRVEWFAETKARYVRMNILRTPPGGKEPAIVEFQVFNYREPAEGGDWWNENLHYRVALAGLKLDPPVGKARVDFTTLLDDPSAEVDLDSARLISAANPQAGPVPVRIVPDAVFEPGKRAIATLLWPHDGEARGYVVYFNTRSTAAEVPAAPAADVRAAEFPWLGLLPEKPVKLSLELPVFNYRRDGQIVGTALLENPSSVEVRGALALGLTDGNFVAHLAPAAVTLPPGGSRRLKFVVDDLERCAPGDWELQALLTEGKKVLGACSTRISLNPPKREEFFNAIYSVPFSSRRLVDSIMPKLRSWGINGFGGHIYSGAREYKYDEALRYGLGAEPSFTAYCSYDVKKDPSAALRREDGEILRGYGGGRAQWPRCSFIHPKVREAGRQAVREAMALMTRYPAFRMLNMNDDVHIDWYRAEGKRLCTGYEQVAAKAFEEKYRVGPPPRPADVTAAPGTVVPDNDPWRCWMRFRCREMYGAFNRLCREEKDKFAPSIIIAEAHGHMQRPFFVPEGGIYPPDDYAYTDWIGSYYYPNQWRRRREAIVQYELAKLGNREKRVRMIPNCTGSPTAHPWLIRAQFWAEMAAGYDAFSWFSYGQPGTKSYWNCIAEAPQTLAELVRVSQVLRELGPFFLRTDPTPQPVAILASFTSSVYATARRGPGQQEGAVRLVGLALLAAHCPFECISEDEVLSERLAEKKVVILSRVNYLPQSVYDRLARYVREGGRVLSYDSPVQIPGAEVVPLEELAGRVRQLAPSPYDCDSQDVLLREFDGAGQRYLVVINMRSDRWYFQEPGFEEMSDEQLDVPLEAVLALPKGIKVAYDLVTRERFEVGDDGKLPLHMAPTWGRVLLLLSEEPPPDRLLVPKTIAAGQPCVIRMGPPAGTPGIWPYRVQITDGAGAEREYSWHVAGQAGDIEYRFTPAVSDPGGNWRVRITNLVTGAQMEKTFRLLQTGKSTALGGKLTRLPGSKSL